MSVSYDIIGDKTDYMESDTVENGEIEWTVPECDTYLVQISSVLGDDQSFTKEFYIYVPDKISTFEWNPNEITIDKGAEFIAPKFSCSVEGLEIKFSTSNPDVATVEAGVITLGNGVGSAVISASFDGNEEYEEAVATCSIKVNKVPTITAAEHTGTWELITNLDNIVDGDVYVLAGPDKDENMYAMTTSATVKYFKGAAVEVEDNKFDSNEYTALVVINKVADGYTMYLTNGLMHNSSNNVLTPTGEKAFGFISCNGYTKADNADKGTDNNATTLLDEVDVNASVATFEMEEETGATVIKFHGSVASETEQTRLYFSFNGTIGETGLLFNCYKQGSQKPVYIYGVYTPAPTNEASNGTVTITAANEQHNIWYRVKGGASAKEGMRRDAAAEQPFISADSHTVTLTLNAGQSVDYYSEYLGRKSAVMNVDYAGNTTGIDEITSENDATIEWYDLSGRRVVAPSKGIFIKKHGNAVTKHMVK